MAYTLITAATTEPVTLAEVKLHVKEDGSENDARLTAFITAARRLAEHKTGRGFAPQTWELVLDAFPEAFALYPAPIVSITSLKYIDTAGVERDGHILHQGSRVCVGLGAGHNPGLHHDLSLIHI